MPVGRMPLVWLGIIDGLALFFFFLSNFNLAVLRYSIRERISRAMSSSNLSDYSLPRSIYLRKEVVGGEATICCSTTKSLPFSISTGYIHLQVAIH